MNFKYQPVLADEEKFPRVFSDRSSTEDSLDATLLESQNGSKNTDRPSSSSHINMKWIWLGQAMFFLASCLILLSAILVRSPTIKHVREFSAYCMLPFFHPGGKNSAFVSYNNFFNSTCCNLSRIRVCEVQCYNTRQPLRRRWSGGRQGLEGNLI